MNNTQVAIVTSLVFAVSACGGGGSKSPAPVKTELNVVDEIPSTPLSNEQPRINVSLVDSAGNPVTGTGQLRIVNDSSGLFSATSFPISAGSVQLTPDTALIDNDNNGVPDSAALFTVVVSDVEGFISSSTQVTLDSFGSQDVSVRLIPVAGIDGLSVAQETVQTETAEVVHLELPGSTNDQNVRLSLGGVIAVQTVNELNASGADDTLEGAVYIPKSIKAYDAAGTELPTESIKISVSAIRPENLAATGAITLSGVVSVSNPAALKNKASLGNVPDGAKKVRLVNLGTTQVTVSSDGSQVANLSPSTPAIIEIEVLPGAINPVTLEPIKIGDEIPLWSRDDALDSWRFEGFYAAQASNSGRLIVRAPILHFSYFSLAFAEVADGCSGTLYIRDDQGEPFAGNGVIHIESERFSLEDVYRGSTDGIISFTDLPAAPTSISFESTDTNGASFVANKSTVAFAEGGSIVAGIAKNIDLCKSQGTTLTARASNTDPVVVVAYKPYLHSAGRVYLNSIREGNIPADAENRQSQLRIPVTLLNPPENDVVLNYSFESGAGLAEAGVDFNDLNTGSVTLSSAARTAEIVLKSIPDTEVESHYKSLRLSIQKPSNAELSRGTESVTVYSAVYDDDRPEFSSVSVTPSVKEGNEVTISASIDRVAVGSVALSYVVSGMANGMVPAAYIYEDVDSQGTPVGGFLANQYTGVVSFRGVITIPEGQTSAAVTIPVAADGEEEPTENLNVKIERSYGAYMPSENQRSFNVELLDADELSATPTNYTLAEKAFKEPFVAPAAVNEGNGVSLSIRLNGVADTDLSFDLALGAAGSANTRDTWFYQAANSPQRIQKSSTISVTIPAGQSGAHVTMFTARDYGVYGNANSAQLTVTPPTGLGNGQAVQYAIRDIDDTEIDWYISSANESPTEGLNSEVNLHLYYYSNDPTAQLDLGALRIDDEHIFPATREVDYNITDSGPYSFAGESGSKSIKVSIVDDQISETSEIIDLYLSGTATSSRRSADDINVYPRDGINLRLFLLDNDKAVLSNKDKSFDLETNTRFKGEVSISLTTPIAFPQAVDTILTLVDAADTGITLAQTTLSIPANSKTASLPISFEDIDPAVLGIPAEGGSVTKKLTVNLKLAPASIESLAENKVEWAIAKADAFISLNFTYSPEKSGPPATGGVGSSQ